MKYSSSDSTKGKNAIKRVEVRTKTLIAQKASHISASECENDHEWAGLFSQVHFHNLFYTGIVTHYAHKAQPTSRSARSSI